MKTKLLPAVSAAAVSFACVTTVTAVFALLQLGVGAKADQFIVMLGSATVTFGNVVVNETGKPRSIIDMPVKRGIAAFHGSRCITPFADDAALP